MTAAIGRSRRMFTRVVTFTGASDLDRGVEFVRDQVAPLLRQQHGFRGMSASVDRSHAVLGGLSLWETEADREASEGALAKTRVEGQGVVGGRVTVETFEEVGLGGAGPPAGGPLPPNPRVRL